MGSAPGSVRHDHRHVPVPRPPGLAGAESPAELGLARDDDVGEQPLRKVERPRGPGCLEDREAVRAQLPLEVLPRTLLLLGEEDGVRWHAATLERRTARHQMSIAPVV